jgi:putative nucleotidyltransferase with HDIG domain
MAETEISKAKERGAAAPRIEVDEELWFGTTDPGEAEAAAASSMAALAGRLIGAKPFPEAARRLAELTRDPNTRTEQIVQVLERDSALSARLLRLVNSAGFGLKQRCSSVRHAVTLVGAARLNQIATTAAVLELFDSSGEAGNKILEHCAVVGAFCRYLGAHLSLPVEDLFTAGFLHDIGKLMLLETGGEGYLALVEEAAGSADMLHVLERAEYGFDHGVLGAHVLKAWNIPDPVPKVVAWHHEPTRAYAATTELASLVQTVRLADALVYAIAHDLPKSESTELAKQEPASYLDISEAQLAAMWDELVSLRRRTLDQNRGDEGEAEPAQPAGERRSGGARHSKADVPLQFPCIECGAPSFGSTCSACSGHACPEHHAPGRAGWCTICEREYAALVAEDRLPTSAILGMGAGLLLVAGIIGFGLARGGLEAALTLAAGPALLVLVGIVVLFVMRRSSLLSRFVRTRPNRFAPATAAHSNQMSNPPGAVTSQAPSSNPSDSLRMEPTPALDAMGRPESVRPEGTVETRH